ncbi:hypothetical protein [Sphingorhabdus sp.]|uniref:hypothetical protein n=1 Tax=Sphingorhabdus sp. TaxID=1902408 RepID=UPI003D812626
MTTVAKLVAAMADKFQLDESSVRNKVRAMQDAEILPLAVGRTVPHISSYHVAAAILGVLASDKVKDAPKAFNRLQALFDRPIVDGMPEALERRLGAPKRLADWLAEQIDFARQFKNPPDFPSLHVETIYSVVINWPEFEASALVVDADDEDKIVYRKNIRFRDHNQFDGWQRPVKHSYAFNGVTLARLVWTVFPQTGQDD